MPVRIEDAEPARSLAYFMAGVHWLDALTPPLEQHLQELAMSIRPLLSAGAETANEPAEPASFQLIIHGEASRMAGSSGSRSHKPIIVVLAASLIAAAAIAIVMKISP